eukprot:7491406-Alexandrium_andersonii.AAC.1
MTAASAGRHLPVRGLLPKTKIARLAAGVARYTCSRSSHVRPRPKAMQEPCRAAQEAPSRYREQRPVPNF